MAQGSTVVFQGPAPQGMVWVEGGTFRMGPTGTIRRRRRYIASGSNGFWIARTPVTNREFLQFVRAGGESHAALRLCIVGLLGVFAVGYPGYFVFDAVWPSFYCSPVPVGKNAWLLAQAFFIGVYFAGAVMMFNAVRRALNTVPVAA